MRFLCITFFLLTSACAAPDVSSFKQSTLALTTNLNDGQQVIISSGDDISKRLGNPTDMEDELKKLRKQGKKVKQFTAILSTYADSIARLASAGKDGTEAAQDLASNIQTAINSSSTAGDPLPSSVTAITSLLGSLVQQSKNKELFQIMNSMKTQVNAIATDLAALPNDEKGIINGFANFWRTERQDLIDYHIAYQELETAASGAGGDNAESLKNALLTCGNDCDYEQIMKDYKKALTDNANRLGKIQALKNEIQVHKEAYTNWDTNITNWQTETIKKIQGTGQLAQAWKKDHQAIIDYLEACTQTSGIFQRKCGAFSAANLQLMGTLIGKAALPF